MGRLTSLKAAEEALPQWSPAALAAFRDQPLERIRI
jgi:hypothetical protein